MKLLKILIILWIMIVLVGLVSPRTASDIIQLLSSYIRIALDYIYIYTIQLILAIKGIRI